MAGMDATEASTTVSRWNLTISTADAAAAAVSEPLAFTGTKIAMYLCIFIVSMLGNSAVIVIICQSRTLRSIAGSLLILNLASCDLVTPLLSITFDIPVEENDHIWPYGAVMCKLLYPAATWSMTSSSLTLAAIAFERYRGLMHPFKSRLTTTQVKRIIAGIHAFSLLVVVPYALVLDLNEQAVCGEPHWPKFSYRQAYTMVLFIVQYVAPLLFMAFMYSQTSKSLFISTERVRASSISSIESATRSRRGSFGDSFGGSFGNIAIRNGPDSPKLSKSIFKNIEQEQNLKITKMFIVVVIIFAICMLPNQALWLWSDFDDGYLNKHFLMAAVVCRFFTYTNSCVNPFIFFKFSREFRRGFRRVFLNGCCVKGRRKISLSYRKWRASRTRNSTSQSTNMETIGTIKSGRAFSISPFQERQESHTSSTTSVFEKEQSESGVPAGNRTRPINSSPQGFWKKKIDNMKAKTCSLYNAIKGKHQEVVTEPGKCGGLSHAMFLTEEVNIEISVNDLMTLSDLLETCC